MNRSVETAEVVTMYLEMTSATELRPKHSDDPQFRIRELTERDWRFNRAMYLRVGDLWAWNDKRNWSDSRWQAYVGTGALRTFRGEYNGELAGYFELHRESHEIEIAYFGLVPEFIGRGLGGPLLTAALEAAWHWDAGRVWVHTCSHDHVAALRNYEARGLRIYKTSRRAA